MVSRFWHYVFALLVIAAMTAIFVRLRDSLDITLIALLYLLPLGLITALWGLAPGIAGAFVTFLSLNYFFVPPYYTFAVHRPTDVVILFIFLVVAVVISQLVGRMRVGLAEATARERDATQLYELSTVLAGLHDDRGIAQALARQLQAVSRAERVQVALTSPAIESQFPDQSPPSRPAEWSAPIQTARGSLGEVRLWRPGQAISAMENRLFRTFASQGALAFERAGLLEAESRARILEESDHLKSALLSSVSHELRTPLSTIKAAASSLRTGEVSWESQARSELVAVIDEEADHLNALVGNLLDMSRIEAGALNPKREWNMLSEIVGDVLTRMRRLAQHHRVEVEVPDTLPLVPVDYVQLQQVFTNLLSNSIKFAPSGSMIRIQATTTAGALQVRVSNEGPQVPPKDLDRIFDKFYRITATDKITGTGLGLSICKGIIEAHGGRIWAENMPGGLSFNFTLPLSLDGARPPQLPLNPELD